MKLYTRWKGPPVSASSQSFRDVKPLTRQEFRDECDINIIMRKYQNTGALPQAWSSPPSALYGDFSEAPDFYEAQQVVVRAQEQFDALPARVRERFANDPARFLDFVHNKENLDEARKLGLLKAEVPPVSPPDPKP